MIVPKQLANTTEFIFDRCSAGIDVVEATVMTIVRADVVRGRVHRQVCNCRAGNAAVRASSSLGHEDSCWPLRRSPQLTPRGVALREADRALVASVAQERGGLIALAV